MTSDCIVAKRKAARAIIKRFSVLGLGNVTFACKACVSYHWVNRALDLDNPLPSKPRPATMRLVLEAAQRIDDSLRGTRHEGLTPSLRSLWASLLVLASEKLNR